MRLKAALLGLLLLCGACHQPKGPQTLFRSKPSADALGDAAGPCAVGRSRGALHLVRWAAADPHQAVPVRTLQWVRLHPGEPRAETQDFPDESPAFADAPLFWWGERAVYLAHRGPAAPKGGDYCFWCPDRPSELRALRPGGQPQALDVGQQKGEHIAGVDLLPEGLLVRLMPDKDCCPRRMRMVLLKPDGSRSGLSLPYAQKELEGFLRAVSRGEDGRWLAWTEGLRVDGPRGRTPEGGLWSQGDESPTALEVGGYERVDSLVAADGSAALLAFSGCPPHKPLRPDMKGVLEWSKAPASPCGTVTLLAGRLTRGGLRPQALGAGAVLDPEDKILAVQARPKGVLRVLLHHGDGIAVLDCKDGQARSVLTLDQQGLGLKGYPLLTRGQLLEDDAYLFFDCAGCEAGPDGRDEKGLVGMRVGI